jgi:NAD(P)-dependent dehydrogenase (short-subunit alcohol dehydrogenase family)
VTTAGRAVVEGLFDLRDRVAVVTGGSRGIGLAVARGLAAMGARVVVASRKAEACQEAVRTIQAEGGDALAVPTHVGELTQIEALVERTVAHYGRLDIVVNNAANALAMPIGRITAEGWAKTQDANERGPLFLVQYALEHLAQSPHAAVVNVISAGVFTHGGYLAMYTAAKAGLLALTRSMAAELAPRGIRVNALAPGPIDTDMVRNNDPAIQARMAAAPLMGRLADPFELVGPVLFLVSDASSFMTGQVLVVDGGLTFH